MPGVPFHRIDVNAMIPGLHHVLTLVSVRRSLVIRFIATSLGRSALSMATILLVKEFLGGILGEGSGVSIALRQALGTDGALYAVAAVLFLTYVGASVLAYDNRVTQQHIVKVLELGMMDRLLHHLLSLSVAFFDRQSHGDVMQAVRHDVDELRLIVFALAQVVMEAVTALGLFAAALWLSPRLTLWALVVMPLAAVPVVLLARRALRRSRTVRKTGYVLFDAILQLLRGIRIIKVFGGEKREAKAALDKARLYFDELIEMVRIQATGQVLLESLASLGIVLVIVIGGFDVMAGRLDWPSLLAFMLAARALHGPLNNINQALVSLGSHGASAERVSELLRTGSTVPDHPHGQPVPALREIEFRDVSFGYDSPPVFSGLSFRVAAGETIGIAGPSGTGKTTLLNLVARFYDPSTGVITLNGRDLREFKLAEVYDNIAVVLQEPFLFATTIRDNIRAGRPDASDAEVEEAARAASVHEEILEMPNRYDTVVGIGGVGVSGGQAQRINIARALLKNPPILLLDEATSALDSVAELAVQTALDRLMANRTTFVVAHRLSTLRGASRILVLDGGGMAGLASHADLVRTCPVYRRMWELQQLGGDDHPSSPDPATPSMLDPEENEELAALRNPHRI